MTEVCRKGALIVNADDWGKDVRNTDRILDCARIGAVSSVSAMMFMEDSERSAEIANRERIEAGLHLNFTAPFTGTGCPAGLQERQERVGPFLLGGRLAQVLFHPGLARAFCYLVAAQLEEFERLYGVAPQKIDGHHHMHLCSNVLMQKLLPTGTIVRRNFSFWSGEKSLVNRVYRGAVDRSLAKRHVLTDYFFSLPPMEPPTRLERIYGFSREAVVELETHPVNEREYEYMTSGKLFADIGSVPIQPAMVAVGKRQQAAKQMTA